MFDIQSLRVDPIKAIEGTWVDYLRGSRLKIARNNNKEAENFRLQKAIEHADVFNAGGKQAEELAFEIDTETTAHYILLDWEGFTNGGQPLEYTPEIGIEFLSNPEFSDFREDVIRISRNREHYRAKAEEEAVKAVKKTADS